ncbi:hypothetical protein NQ176_g10753 [Zarea fungicola]|uniref:Uncharacterized protein n=1 Tax=Zarea fungicola TaxID=93591 RepID=A0ACC1MFY8_9HYPO|nr:hypothetical protein NQ176_g10753 [Lecanicillium fungicola]
MPKDKVAAPEIALYSLNRQRRQGHTVAVRVKPLKFRCARCSGPPLRRPWDLRLACDSSASCLGLLPHLLLNLLLDPLQQSIVVLLRTSVFCCTQSSPLSIYVRLERLVLFLLLAVHIPIALSSQLCRAEIGVRQPTTRPIQVLPSSPMAVAVNGAAAQPTKGNEVTRKSAKRKQGFFTWTISFVARLATWAAILTILFRCPATLEECDETSPFVCRRYFQVKNAVLPHAKPYYDMPTCSRLPVSTLSSMVSPG